MKIRAIVDDGNVLGLYHLNFGSVFRNFANDSENKEKWYKFNVIFVEEFEMNEETLEAECLGGTYKAAVYDTVNSYPETRHRYWKGHMLFYESSDKLNSQYGSAADGSGLVRHDIGLRSPPPSPSSSSISSSSGPPSPIRTDGLNQLTALLQRGEKKAFSRKKCQLLSREWFTLKIFNSCKIEMFITWITSDLSSTWHLAMRTQTEEWCSCVGAIVKNNSEACVWFVNFLAGERGKGYI
ncbi:Ubiquitin carboxyl-terminal hydrolase 24, partial [Stylophora pistillata]